MAARRPSRPSFFDILLVCCFGLLAFLLYLNYSDGASSSPSKFQIALGSLHNSSVQLDSSSYKSINPDGFKWKEEVPPFYVYDLVREGSRGASKEKLLKDCASHAPLEFCNFLMTAPRRVDEEKEADLFLVPIFDSVLYSSYGLRGSIERLSQNRYWMKFRGSDFVFVCYTRDCELARRAVIGSLGKAIRAIWVDRSGESEWPCPNRKIAVEPLVPGTAEVVDWENEAARVGETLILAKDLIRGRNRWKCESVGTWGIAGKAGFDFGTIKDTSFKSKKERVAYCGVPKVGSSVAVLLMRRMNGMPDWKMSNTLEIRNFATGYDWRYKSKEQMVDMYDQTDWVKGMIVRDPISRLLSGYRSKIEDLREYGRIPGGWPSGKPPTFEEFIERIKEKKGKGNLDWMDRHIRPQSALCGVRHLPYDFIGRYEDRHDDMKAFLESLELWDSLGANGWGADGTAELYAEDEAIIRRNKPKPVTHADKKSTLRRYYTRELVETVIHLYDEDFTRFGFSRNVDDYI